MPSIYVRLATDEGISGSEAIFDLQRHLAVPVRYQFCQSSVLSAHKAKTDIQKHVVYIPIPAATERPLYLLEAFYNDGACVFITKSCMHCIWRSACILYQWYISMAIGHNSKVPQNLSYLYEPAMSPLLPVFASTPEHSNASSNACYYVIQIL